MYCIERGSEGMILPKTELHTQLEAWEREMERAWEEVGNVKAELMRVAAELRGTCTGSGRSMWSSIKGGKKSGNRKRQARKRNRDTKRDAGKKATERERAIRTWDIKGSDL